jgi:uncharacterized damage-inducible protein DinB
VDATTEALLNSLNNQRDHVIGSLDGLTPEDLHKPVLPTGWSCLGLVQHLALDVERFWFRAVMAGEVPIDDGAASAWEVEVTAAPEVVLDRYRSEIAQANRVIEATPLEQAPVAWPAEMFGSFRLPDLRAMLLHVITETACHAGHLDAARELLDGGTWLIL